MTTKELYQKPAIEALEVPSEGVVCSSDVIAVMPDYGDAVEGEW